MTAPAYSTDLQDVNLCDAIGTWAEMSTRKSGGAPVVEDRAYIQGNYSISQSTGVATGRTCGMEFDYGGNISGWTTGWVFLVWQYWQAPKAMGTWADGGMRFGVGSASGDWNLWNTQGNDYGRNPYGGWANVAIDPTFAYDEQEGTPTAGNYRWFCTTPYILSGVSKGNPHCVDAIRYGRAEFKVAGGTDSSADHCSFEGMAAANDADAARWGLFQEQFGAYLWKGLMSLGAIGDSSTGTVPVDFMDSNKVILVEDVPRTYKTFNRIEINDEDSIVNWTSITFISLGTLSPGQLEVVDNADVNFEGCSFTDMDTFIFQSNCSILNCIFQGCGQITAGGADMTGSKILAPSVAESDSSSASPGTTALVWNVNTDPDGLLDDMTFSVGAEPHHAIEFGTTSPTTMTIRGMTTSGFNASNNEEDSTFHIKRTSGTVTINVVDGIGNFSYKTEGATVVINTGKTLTLTGIVENSEVTIMKAGDDSSAAELHHAESITATGETVYSFDAGMQGKDVDILIMHLDYEPFLQENYTLPSSNTTLPISQVEDRVYRND